MNSCDQELQVSQDKAKFWLDFRQLQCKLNLGGFLRLGRYDRALDSEGPFSTDKMIKVPAKTKSLRIEAFSHVLMRSSPGQTKQLHPNSRAPCWWTHWISLPQFIISSEYSRYCDSIPVWKDGLVRDMMLQHYCRFQRACFLTGFDARRQTAECFKHWEKVMISNIVRIHYFI